MKCRVLPLLLLAALGVGCAAQKTQRTPALAAPPPDAPPPAPAPRRNIVREVGDTTWNVVTAPARLLVPQKPPPKEPEVYEAPDAVFRQRNDGDENTLPATRP